MRQGFRLPPMYTALDILLILIVGAVSAGFYGSRLNGAHAAGGPLEAVVQSGDRVLARLDMSRDTLITVTGALGPVEISVRGGGLSFRDAVCPQKICEQSGPISRNGTLIVCAPNRVLARIQGTVSAGGDELDALSR
jgi:hypothetical protein